MTRYTDATNTGVPVVPMKSDSSTTRAENLQLHEETVLSHRAD